MRLFGVVGMSLLRPLPPIAIGTDYPHERLIPTCGLLRKPSLGEVRRIPLPRTPLNRARRRAGASLLQQLQRPPSEEVERIAMGMLGADISNAVCSSPTNAASSRR
jgi:hypothetical protein